MSWDHLRSSYDRVAEVYEEHFVDELADKPLDRELLAPFASVAADPVLDLGCGPGQIGAALRAAGRTVMGLDLSTQMAGRARRRLGAASAGDLRALPIRDGAAGSVIAFFSIIHLPRGELGRGLTEIRRVLRPGGRALVSVHEGAGTIERDDFLGAPVPFVATLFGRDELIAATTEAGLDVVATRTRAPYAGEAQTTRLYLDARRPD